MFFKINGGRVLDEDGVTRQLRVWWPIQLLAMLDAFIRTLMGRGNLGFPSTATFVFRSMSTHQPRDQKINLIMMDADSPDRVLWGTCLSPQGAREVAERLFVLAEQIEPFYTTSAGMERAKRGLADAEEMLRGQNGES